MDLAQQLGDRMLKAQIRRFHVESGGWTGHGTGGDNCHMCRLAADAATAEAIIVLFETEGN